MKTRTLSPNAFVTVPVGHGRAAPRNAGFSRQDYPPSQARCRLKPAFRGPEQLPAFLIPARSILFGLALAALLSGANARAAISLLDGGTNSTGSAGSGVDTISQPFAVSPGASVMVVALYDDNNDTSVPGPDLVWNNSASGTPQLLTPCIETNTTAYGWTWADLYYLWNPSPGTGAVTGTDAAATHNYMFIEVFTLSGVDTNVAPTGLGNGTGTATTLSVNTPSGTAAGSWAAVVSVNYNGGGGNDIALAATSGEAAVNNFRPDGLQCIMGYISGLAAGRSTITATATGSATHMDLAAAVFSPYVAQGSVTTPTNLVAAAQTNQVALSWADSSGGAATSYLLLRSVTSGSGYMPIATNTGSASTSYTDRTVYDGTTYYYEVEAANSAGTSLPSSQASATPFFALPPGLSGNIALLDGGTNALVTVASGAGSTISSSFTVSQGASVLVVELWDRNTLNNNSSPSFMTWAADAGTTQTLTRAVSEVSGASTYSDCDIYYLFNPTPGAGTVTGTDTNTVTIQGLTMMPFTLSGVDTTVAPVIYGTNAASATTLSVATAPATPPGAWAAVLSYDGNTGHPITNASTSGVSTSLDVANNQEQALGYVARLAGGSSTIFMTEGTGGGATKCTLAVAVFMPAIGTGIALQDGTINSTSSAGSGAATIAEPFAVSQGASVMVVALFDNNNNTQVPGPDLTWSNATLGTAQPFTLCESTNTTAYTWTWADLYYLWDPLPGAGLVTGTDTNATHNYMFMQVYTLSGVDTTVAPYGVGNGSDTATALSLDTLATTVASSWAAVMSVNYNGGGGNDIAITGTSGQAVANNFRPNGLQCTMGYISAMAAGDSTITANATGGATHMDVAAEVFSPLVVLSAPASVAATGQTNQVSLSWADGSGGAATSYLVLRSTTSGSGFTAIATNLGNASTTFTDTKVTDWTTYYYVVQAVGPGGASVFSAQVSAYAMGMPAGVTGLAATAGINQVALSWSNQLGAGSYTILRSTTSGSGFTSIGSAATNSFTDAHVINGTLYYYEVNASNSFGASTNSSPVSAVPVVAFFTNWIGVFNSSADVAGWMTLNGNANAQFLSDNPGYGPSSGCLVLDATFGPGGTAAFQGLATAFQPSLNVSTYPFLELDIKNQGVFDEYGQIQAIQLNLQLPANGVPAYERGTSPDIVLYQSGTGSAWTHYAIPMADWSGYNLAGLTAFGINIYDGDTTAATELDPGFANIAFTGAPAWASAFSGLANPTIASGSTNVSLTGTVSGTVAGTNVYLANGTTVTVTINGNTQTTAIDDSTGDFTVDFNTTGFANGAYTVTYVAASDLVGLIGATNRSTTLTLSVNVPATPPTILPPSLETTGTNLAVKVATQSGHSYYLLTAASLTPPVVWTTNSLTAGSGGVITNLLPITKSDRALFLKYLVQ